MYHEVGLGNQHYWMLFVFVVFFAFASKSVAELWEYVPYVDEAANVSAVSNLLSEGIPRVGPTKGTVNYVEQPVERIMWDYFLETIIRVPISVFEKILKVENLQAITNLLFLAMFLFYNYIKILKNKVNTEILSVLSITLTYVMFSKGLMQTFHYVRYYPLSIVVFIFSIFAIVQIFDSDNKYKYVKMLGLSIIPMFFHLLYAIYFFAVVIAIILDLICKRQVKFYKFKIGKHELLGIAGIIFMFFCGGFLLAYRVIYIRGG